MNVWTLIGILAIALLATIVTAEPLRPPAVPLVTHDPYFSVWSMSDRLTDDWSRHWTGSVMAMCGMARVDGKPYRFMGTNRSDVPPMEQISLEVLPTRTIYRFRQAGVEMTLTFMSPLLPHDLNVLARPVTYLTWDVKSADGKPHEVSIYFDASGEWAVNTADQEVVWSHRAGNMTVMKIGTEAQPVLAKSGDTIRADWGYFRVGIPGQDGLSSVIASDETARGGFSSHGRLPKRDDTRMPRAASDEWPVLACVFDLGKVGSQAVSRHLMLTFDQEYAFEYMGRRLRPYWRKDIRNAHELLDIANRDYLSLRERCEKFDRELAADLTKVGGKKYSALCSLAYRQCLAAHGLAATEDGDIFMFSKENSSNGCIGTVDVIYPPSPFFLFLNPDLLKANLTPVFEYAGSGRWPHPFAPHDLGQYPLANGQVYGGGERTEENQMPVEESGNMLLMAAALAKLDGNADYALKYWPQLTQWAEYLREKGLDPENQLSTDDFTGHLAHNANLSLKAILALRAYSMLCEMAGKSDEAREYRNVTEGMVTEWIRMADDGDHFRLAFDKPGTWSQKYNLVWDKLLGFGLFPPEVARTEIAWYKTRQNQFGLPLDNRDPLTKTDWLLWSATLAESREDFEAFVDPAYEYFHRATRRTPMADLYWTDNLEKAWLVARPVIGGIYIKMLSDPETWKKWSSAE